MDQNLLRLTEKQTKAWDILDQDNGINEVGYGGAGRGGKTYLGASYFTTKAITLADTKWLIGRKEGRTLKLTVLPTIYKIFKIFELKKDVHYFYDKQIGTITFLNDSQFLLMDCAYAPSDPNNDRFGSLEITGGWLEEAAEISLSIIHTIQTRCGNWNNDKYGIKPITLETFNPSKNHVYFRYWKPFKTNTMPGHRSFIPALPSDNQYQGKQFIQKVLETGDKTLIERLVRGNFDYDDDDRSLVKFDNISNLFSNEFVDEGEKYISFDVAGMGKDKTVILVWSGFRITRIIIIDKNKQDWLFDFIDKLAHEEKVPRSHIIGDYTGIGTGVCDFLKCIGFQGGASPINSQENEYREFDDELKFNKLYRNLRAQCYSILADKINKNEIFIKTDDENIQMMITEELGAIRKKKQNSDEPIAIIPKHSDNPNEETIQSIINRSPDLSDAIMMRIYFELSKPAETLIVVA